MDKREVTKIKPKGKMIIAFDDGKRIEIEDPEILLVKRIQPKK